MAVRRIVTNAEVARLRVLSVSAVVLRHVRNAVALRRVQRSRIDDRKTTRDLCSNNGRKPNALRDRCNSRDSSSVRSNSSDRRRNA